MSSPRLLVPAALAALAAACGGNGGGTTPIDAAPAPFCQPTPGTDLTLVEIVSGLRNPVGLTAPAGDPRLFVLEQQGRIRVVRDGALLPTPYVDLMNRVNSVGNEQGLLGLAFHPRFRDNGKLYVFYTAEPSGTITVSELVAPDPTADTVPATERVLFTETHPQDNHNGGTVTFGPDGYLYVSMGDGGGANDFGNNGQNPQTIKAKVLRLDVDGAQPYGIPPSNPWAGGGGVPEMYAWGLRNPWRITIDPANGDLYIGDVGQGAFEEVDYVPAGAGGQNFGWSVFEGPMCFTDDPDGNLNCDRPGDYASPLVAMDRRQNEECSVVAGAVYRGTCMPDLVGHFFYGDFCAGVVRTLRVAGGQAVDQVDRTDDVDPSHILYQQLSSFGVDGYNELYVMAHSAGRVYRIEAQ